MSTTASKAAKTERKPRDVRGFWRVLLAVLAPVPMLLQGIVYLINPVGGNAPFDQALAAIAADQGRFELMQWLQVPFFLLIPATFAVAWVTRRQVPRLSTAGAVVCLGGLGAGLFLLGGPVTPDYMTVHAGLDPAVMDKFSTAMEDQPIVALGGLLFILAITVGLLLQGLALWRSRVAPAWMGIALAVGGFTHPFMPTHVIAGIGLMVAAVGFAGASVALLRTSNDAFDLPPLG
ncbi:hypothetical protein [Kribbella pittospori]|uniref:hypothetical protein n=1 Tax=Kribbella pittospori TaxID=722689 RepID=UPI0013F468B6|nr:hypothetical protein [Kribbella pittospori]